ncbi:hypothetical protein HZC09_04705 [Candidatus Micrarchaeota archaeon]|nr:hypothetical protein [Candidatus Micrarchaeota archaeon]
MDVVEVDPFGTPAPFMAHALELLGDKGLLSVTATDLATLCGRNSKPVERRYRAETLYLEYSHEIALRIILGKIVREANARGFKAKPLFSFYRDHYVKFFVLVEKEKQKQELGFVSHCFKCGNRVEGKKAKCYCGHTFKHAGPLWVGETSDLDIVEAMAQKTENEKTKKFLETIANEQFFPPYFFDVHKTVKRTGTPVKPMADYLGKLKEKGFKAERTHYAPTAFKTNASFKDVLSVF